LFSDLPIKKNAKPSYSFGSFATPVSAKPPTNHTRGAFAPNEYLASLFPQGGNSSSSPPPAAELSRELAAIKLRLEKVEKAASLAAMKPKTSVEKFMDSLAADTLEMNPKNIERCSTIGLFCLGSLLGYSLLDR